MNYDDTQTKKIAADAANPNPAGDRRGKLFVIEGVDGSGKATQTQLLYQALCDSACGAVRQVSFPDYDSLASGPLRMYLNGEFGSDPASVNAYATSVLFAVDRFASFRKDWQDFYNEGGVVIADRYVTSNLVHQAGKLPAEERARFADWLNELEYGIFGLPRPDGVIFLDMPPRYSLMLRQARHSLKQGLSRDIHEADEAYLTHAYETACAMARQQGWLIVHCVQDEQIRTVEDIHCEIFSRLRPFLKDSAQENGPCAF